MNHAQKWVTAYEHTLKILEMNQDNYFKRNQILMIAFQIAFFAAFAKMFTTEPKPRAFVPLIGSHPLILHRLGLTIIAGLGAAGACVWRRLIHRQSKVLDLCKSYLMGIENSLMRLGIPSGYWTYESMISHPKTYMESDFDSYRNVHQRINRRLRKLGLRREWVPHIEGEEFAIGLTTIERKIALFLSIFWIILALPFAVSLILTFVR